jgi:hypothetical protein
VDTVILKEHTASIFRVQVSQFGQLPGFMEAWEKKKPQTSSIYDSTNA